MTENTSQHTQNTEPELTPYTYLPKPAIIDKMKILVEKRKEEQMERERLASMPKKPYVHDKPQVGRNDPCSCGSGKKYKKCCLLKEE